MIEPIRHDTSSLSPLSDRPVLASDRNHNGERVAARLRAAWLVGIILLVLWSAWHLGATHLAASVRSAAGIEVQVPNTFATVDHPYHAARAQLLLDSLRDRRILRWVGSHEGGYPVEFYPLGIPWLTVGLWALLLGAFPIAAAAKLVVIGIFLSPVLVFAGLGRLSGAAMPVTGLALLVHLAVPGEWWSGGYTETVQWGLVTNVAAYIAAFGFLAALLAVVLRPGRLVLLASIGLSSFAVATNTRSVIALVCVVIGVAVSVMIQRGRTFGIGTELIRRLALVGIPGALLTAPLWLSLLRFGDYYEFIRYQYYSDLGAYWTSSVNAVSWPVMILGLAGLAMAVAGRSRVAPRAAAWTLISYVVATLLLGGLGPNDGLIAQLEATRLMPFQRLLVIYLAATTVVQLTRLARRWRRDRFIPDSGLLVLTVVLAVVFIIRPLDSIPADQRSMFPVETTATPAYADLSAAVRIADTAAPVGTAIFIAGSDLGWHEPLWAPFATDRPLRYNDWLWLWQTWHRADQLDYDGQAIRPNSTGVALRPDYLAQQGIGTVIVLTPQIGALADRSKNLQRLPGAGYPVYRVMNAVPIITSPGATVGDPSIGNQTISAIIDGAGGTVTVSETWFPRWRATVDGHSVPVGRDEFGRMTVAVPAGRVALDLVYGVDLIDWVGRIAALLGLLLAILLILWRRPFRVIAGVVPNRDQNDALRKHHSSSRGSAGATVP